MTGRQAKWSSVLAALAVLPVLGACSTAISATDRDRSDEADTVVVASDSTPRGAVLAEIYAAVLQTSGTRVSVHVVADGRTARLAALDSAEVTLVPEFTGSLLAHYDPSSRARTGDDVFEALSRSLPEGLAVSDYATAEDRAVLAIDSAYAETMKSTTLSDFAPSCATATAVVTEEFENNRGIAQLEDGGDCRFARVRTGATAGPDSRTVFGTTTLSEHAQSGSVTVLADTEHVLAAQNVVPLFRVGALGDSQIKALSVVAGELSTTDLATMISQVETGSATAASVARQWWDTRQ
ncbi:osmoprotectant transport system substrate-binding protein [Rhodococcus sp. 27YEA15]|uniref:ABC transporter substrate-binding protein n=1 Tax=Rhodococcus sp. 27YEA15 TaxID=3156259 RepID=UPI003C7A825C